MTTMKKQNLTLAGVPAILYGERSRKVYLYVHGKNGCKEEAERFANTACAAGWQVLAIDLPEHGARRDRPEQLLPWAVVPEIQAVYARMQPVWPHIRLYGVSIGAWLAMQALRAEKPEKALLVSPVVDMENPNYRFVEECVRECFPDAGVAPYIMLGGTDARHYAPYCPCAVRFAPLVISGQQMGSVHARDENVDVDAVAKAVKFYRYVLENHARIEK